MTLDQLILLTLGATLVACALAVAGLRTYAAGRAQHRTLVERLSQTPPVAGGDRRFAALDRRLRRTAPGRRLELRLAATGLDLTPGEYTVYVASAVAALWLAAQSLLSPFFGPLAAVLGLGAANAFLNWQRQKRIDKFINQLPELARLLANGTQAGLALRTAITMAAEEMDAPAGEELTKVSHALGVGHSLDDALGELAARLPSRELVVLVTTLVLSNRAGGQVVSSLRNLTETLEQRKETRREVRTQLSQVMMTAYAVPLIGLTVLLMMDRAGSGVLDRMTSTFVGQAAVVLAFSLYAAGFLVIRRMSRIDV
ncbi:MULTISPECIES: type II secretion system F family protein [unclassified Streptomyces]|uniref:type II secretion system F family protein n=1 Tax=unclassified Streptomyces TaxID=2593676 RepID=UPI0022B63202|nr:MULTISPECIES: type II secretion system F family protein [unclassified Streptomyces]MCZ7416788.1 type II secretion system F family protein [Streptomyces sp. WMMC897]MCZ7433402.1 type II secretion system F family protein [Streptomyces sp. WMMC1477]